MALCTFPPPSYYWIVRIHCVNDLIFMQRKCNTLNNYLQLSSLQHLTLLHASLLGFRVNLVKISKMQAIEIFGTYTKVMITMFWILTSRYSDSPTSELEGRTPKGRSKRGRGGGTPVETETRKNLRSSKVNNKGRGNNLSQANSPAKRKGRPGEGGDEKRARTGKNFLMK